MDAQPDSDLEGLYAAAADEARRTVAAEFDLYDVTGHSTLPSAVRKERYRAVWRVMLPGADVVDRLFIAVPWIFPDELPDVFLDQDLQFEGTRIPHLDSSWQLCTFDDSARFPNPARAGVAVLEVIARARETIAVGVLGNNRADYWDEFEAYWIEEVTKGHEALSLVKPKAPHRRVIAAALEPPLSTYRYVFAEDDSVASAFLAAISRPQRKLRSTAALYLHLESLPTPTIRTNGDVYRALSVDARVSLLEFLKDSKRPTMVLFSLPIEGQRVFAAWRHQSFGFNVYRGKGSSQRINDQARGFRKGRLTPELELKSVYAGLEIGRIVVHRTDSERLVSRTRGESSEGLPPVNIIGCGSVGGYLASIVASVRPAMLRLVDRETLEIHNVPRHVCDLPAVGTNKAVAVGALVRRRDPSLVVVPVAEDVLDKIRVYPTYFTPAQWTFVAVANLAIERRLNEVSRRHDLGNLAFVWIEPHAVAGHAVVVPRGAVGCLECLINEDLVLEPRVLTDADQFARHEAGCRGSYIPYGGIDFQSFLLTISREILATKSASNGTLITWLGALGEASKRGWRLEPQWTGVPDYSVLRRKIAAKPSCPVCSK